MTALARLGLGTVQFGLDYGVSNRGGRPPEREAAAILARAAVAGVGYIDTAPAYGDAEVSDRSLSSARPWPSASLRRAPALRDATIDARHGRHVLDSLAASLDRLKVNAVHGYLVHQSDDLARPGWQHLVDAMHEARARGWTSRIGASVYNSDQLELVESRFQPQLVQLPLNVLDRRPIVSGMLARLKAAGVEIHARSVFLQGLLLMEPDELPEFFAPVRPDFCWPPREMAAARLNSAGRVLGLRFAAARNRCRHCRRQSHARVFPDRSCGGVIDERRCRYRRRSVDGRGLP